MVENVTLKFLLDHRWQSICWKWWIFAINTYNLLFNIYGNYFIIKYETLFTQWCLVPVCFEVERSLIPLLVHFSITVLWWSGQCEINATTSVVLSSACYYTHRQTSFPCLSSPAWIWHLNICQINAFQHFWQSLAKSWDFCCAGTKWARV